MRSDANFGGNADAAKSELQGGVRHVVGNENAFAAEKEVVSIVTGCREDHGGNSDSEKSEL